MLKPKQGICPDCPPGSAPRFLTAGRCQTHYWQHRHGISVQRIAKRNPERKEQKDELGKWFEHHNTHNSWICENCGKPIKSFSRKAASAAQAHILPKSKFKSVQSVLENHMTLGDPVFHDCSCHDDYDSSWQRAEGMLVFTLAKQRFITFRHLIYRTEYKFLPEPFYQMIYAH